MSILKTDCLAAVATVVIAAFSGAAYAHETLPKDWCMKKDQKPEIVIRFDFNGEELNELAAKCGIVEKPDEWHTVSESIASYCEIVAPLKSARPLILGPKEYLDERHHRTYWMKHGLSGVCAVCR